jgi:hypothetical protein
MSFPSDTFHFISFSEYSKVNENRPEREREKEPFWLYHPMNS